MKWSESDHHPEIEPWFSREELRRKIVTLNEERLELTSEFEIERLNLASRIAWLEGRVIALDFHIEEARTESQRLRSETHRLGKELGRIHHSRLWRLYSFYRELLGALRKLPLIGRIAGR